MGHLATSKTFALIALFAFLTNFSTPIFATDLCGIIAQDDTLTLAGSPYVLTCDVTVEAGATLTIEPGVIINLANRDRDFHVRGSLVAVGTVQDSITFYSSSSQGGGSLAFLAGSQGNVLNYTRIENLGKYYIYNTYDCALWIDHAEVNVNYSSFQNNLKDVRADASSVGGFGPDNDIHQIWFRNSSLDASSIWPNINNPDFEYVTEGSLSLAAGQTLNINPGVTLNLSNRAHNLSIYGALLVLGTVQDSVTIYSSSSSGGGSLAFLAGSNNLLRYLNIKNLGNYYIYNTYDCAVWIDHCTVDMDYCSFSNNARDIRANPTSCNNFGPNNALNRISLLNNSLDTTATLSFAGQGSEYFTEGSLNLVAEDTLTLREGVSLNISNRSHELNINGTFIAEGTTLKPITVYSSSSDGGGSLAFLPNSKGFLRHTFIRNLGNYAIYNYYDCALWIDHAEVDIDHCTFEDNSKDVRASASSVGGFGGNNDLYRIWFTNNSLDASSLWPNADSGGFEYVTEGDLSLAATDTLTMAEGITLNLAARDHDLHINGDLQVNSTAQNPVKFYSTSGNGGGSLALLPGSKADLNHSILSNLGIYYIYNTYDCALWIDHAEADIDYCTFENNIRDVRANASSVAGFGPNNRLNQISFTSNSLDTSSVWPNADNTGFEYITEGDLSLAATDSLSIAPGVTLNIASRSHDLRIHGDFQAIGTAQDSIVFYSSASNGGGSLALLAGSTNNNIKYAKFQRLGINNLYNDYDAAIRVYTDANISNSLFENNHVGIWIDGNSAPVIRENHIQNNSYGIYSTDSNDPEIAFNSIENNTNHGLYSSGETINACNNYWGHPTGPYNAVNNPSGQGNQVSNSVVAASCLLVEPTYVSLSPTLVNTSCIAATDGSISLSINGGVSPYLIQWSTESTDTMITNLAAGTYSVTVNDSDTLFAVETYQIVDPLAVVVDYVGLDTICVGDSTILGITNAALVNWSTGENSFELTVSPITTTTYYVTGHYAAGCPFSDSITVYVRPYALPGQVTAMVPANDAENLVLPLEFSWTAPANSDSYDLYIWPEGDARPATPVAAGISSNNYNFNGTIDYGSTYNWQLVAHNICFETEGITQQFTLRQLPDLAVLNVLSGLTNAAPNDTLSLTWNVSNVGEAASLIDWTEKIYIESSTGQNRTLLEQLIYLDENDTLNVGENYARSAQIILPQVLAIGEQAVFVVELIPSSNILESPLDLANNTGIENSPWNISNELHLSLNKNQITEGSSSLYCTVSRSGSIAADLTFDVVLTESNRFSYPAQVTIYAGQTGRCFYVNTVDNSDLDGPVDIDLSINATGYTTVTKSFLLLDDEMPGLFLANLPTSLEEGGLLNFDVGSNFPSSDTISVNISSSNPTKVPLPTPILILPNTSSTPISIQLPDDAIPGAESYITISAGSAGFAPATDGFTLTDENDLPAIAFEILVDTIAESGGQYASQGKITRLGNSNGTLTVKINQNTSALYLPYSVQLDSNETEKTFYLGAIDNSVVDGFRNITVTASVYIAACNCNAPPSSVGTASDLITIADDDGPSLSISVDPLSLPEGATLTGMMTISRNTSTASPLVVTLSSSDETEIILPNSITIPAAAASYEFLISTETDALNDGSVPVTLTASAPSFSPGIISVTVTDINKPDFDIVGVNLDQTTLPTLEPFQFRTLVANKGTSNASAGVALSAYWSTDALLDAGDILAGDYTIDEPILAGDTVEVWDLATTPFLAGDYYLLFQVNPDEILTELLYINNTSTPLLVTVEADYQGTAIVDDSIFVQNTPITIYGTSFENDGTPLPNAALEVYLITGPIRRSIPVTTDNLGNYTTTFQPLPNEGGHFSIGASFPGQQATEEQDAFDILGMRVNSQPVVWELVVNDTLRGTIPVSNLSNIELNDLTIEALSLPAGASISFDSIPVLLGNETIGFNFELTSTAPSPGPIFQFIPLVISTTENVSYEFTASYYCQALEGYLTTSLASINQNIPLSQSNFVEVKIYNNGQGQSGAISVSLPSVDFMSLVTPQTIPSLASGDSAVLVLQFDPTTSLPFNTPASGTIVLNATNSNSVTLPFTVEKVSNNMGSLVVDVIDEFTYFTAESPHVANAAVKVSHYYTGEVYAEGFTDAQGLFMVDSLPVGLLRLTVQATQHDGHSGVINIQAGATLTESVFISYRAISFTWDVVPTTVEDEYEIDLVMEFETFVPVPVVTMEKPSVFPVLTGNQTFNFNITLTNRGLITAQNLGLVLPANDPEYEFITTYTTADLPALSAIQVPVVMRLRQNAQAQGTVADDFAVANSLLSLDSSPFDNTAQFNQTGACAAVILAPYKYICGNDTICRSAGGSVGYTGRSCGGTFNPQGGGGGSGSVSYPSGTSGASSCIPCLDRLIPVILAAGACIPGPYGAAFCIAGCAYEPGLAGCATCIPGLPTPISCGGGLLVAMGGCGFIPPFPLTDGPVNNLNFNSGDFPVILQQPAEDFSLAYDGLVAANANFQEIYGDMVDSDGIVEFAALIENYVRDQIAIPPTAIQDIKIQMDGYDLTEQQLDDFFLRWNESMEAWDLGIYSPNGTYPNIVDLVLLEEYLRVIQSVLDHATSRGYYGIDEMYVTSLQIMEELATAESEGVCASVTIQISQQVTMTREAFEGTLVAYNGHPTDALQDFELNLEILDPNGVISNDLFQIETLSIEELTAIDGTGSLAAGLEGTVKILFIPEPGAAPTVPISYSFGGSIDYLDPYTGLAVSIPLTPSVLQVNPSPDLYLHYFMQRNIYGDDPLTAPIEPIIPGELAVMVENNGYGTANNLMIESAQPEIIDNEKGLAINFSLIGSNLQGQPVSLGLNNINFGNIDPLSTKVGQWYFTSTLLGHFIDYETNMVHMDSYGNPDLSLIAGVELHELLRSISVYNAEDGIDDFLVNEIQDPYETPDAIYLSQGNLIYDVFPADTAYFEGDILAAGNTNTFTMDPFAVGWNYIKLDDPGNGNFEIVSVTRSDGQEIPLKNAWLSHVTLNDARSPTYEDKFHIVDDFSGFGPVTYTVVWSPKDPNPPFVASITGQPSMASSTQIANLVVTFSEPIIDSTFGLEDLTLVFQGGNNLIDSTVIITQIDATSYNIDLSGLTTGNGYYLFTVQAAGVQDLAGTFGEFGEQVGWTQFLSVPAVQDFLGLPEGNIASAFDTLQLLFNMPIDETTLLPSTIQITYGGIVQTGNMTISAINAQNTLFEVTGLGTFMGLDGQYDFEIDMTKIQAADGTFGLAMQSISLFLDTEAPQLINLLRYIGGGLDGQHYTGVNMNFSEDVHPIDSMSVFLSRDGIPLDILSVPINKVDGDWYQIESFGFQTYQDGDYLFRLDLSQVKDLAGNYGSGTEETTWTVNRVSNLFIAGLGISPDRGFSTSDGVTSENELTISFGISEDATLVEIYQNDNGSLSLLHSRDNVPAGNLSVPVVFTSNGNTQLLVKAFDSQGIEATANKYLYIDQSALAATWDFAPNQELEEQPNSIDLSFSDLLLDISDLDSTLVLTYNNTNLPTDGLSLQASSQLLSDTTFTLTGLENIGTQVGTYTVGIDLTQLSKYNSGLPGTSTSLVSWEIVANNRAPIADAGQDSTVITQLTYTLDASNSYDPDGDSLTYLWYAPPGITLLNANSATPSFNINTNTTGELDFLVSVDDGRTFSTDVVTVNVQLDQVRMNVKMFLQGPYIGNGQMRTTLLDQGELPNEQPYNNAPWNYAGTESVSGLPADVVDWVLVSARITEDPGTTIGQTAVLLRNDGQIINPSGGNTFTMALDTLVDSLYLTVLHRNHVGLMSATPIPKTNGLYQIDFRQDDAVAFGDQNGIKNLGDGNFGLFSGDFNGNGQVQNTDLFLFFQQIGIGGYWEGDFNLNSEVQNTDLQNFLNVNIGRGASFSY